MLTKPPSCLPLRSLLFSAAPPAIVLTAPPAIVIRLLSLSAYRLSIVIRSSHGRAVCPPLRMFSIALRSCHGCAVTALRSNLLVIVLRLSVCYCFPLSIVAALLCLLIRRQAYVWLTYSLRSTCYPLSSARYYRPAWGWTSAIQPTAA